MRLEEYKLNFDKVFSHKGGVFNKDSQLLDYETNFGIYSEYVHDIIQTSVLSNVPPGKRNNLKIYFDYVDSLHINASADKKDNIYYIAINSGAVYLIERLFYTMLSKPKVLDIIGNASSETLKDEVNLLLLIDIRKIIDNKITLQYPKPSDTYRLAVAQFLTASALGFLALHELTHILDGHIDYTRTSHVKDILNKKYEDNEPNFRNILLQTLEFDADSIAISMLINYALASSDNPGILSKLYPFVNTEKHHVVGLSMLGAYSVFRIFGNDQKSDKPFSERRYPSFEVRRKLLHVTAASLLLYKVDKNKLDAEASDRILSYIFYYLTESDAAIENEDVKDIRFLEKNTENHLLDISQLSHMKFLKSNWQKIVHDLIPHAYQSLFIESVS